MFTTKGFLLDSELVFLSSELVEIMSYTDIGRHINKLINVS